MLISFSAAVVELLFLRGVDIWVGVYDNIIISPGRLRHNLSRMKKKNTGLFARQSNHAALWTKKRKKA
jgi:hypothetical protein